jgi:hypothetical protein
MEKKKVKGHENQLHSHTKVWVHLSCTGIIMKNLKSHITCNQNIYSDRPSSQYNVFKSCHHEEDTVLVLYIDPICRQLLFILEIVYVYVHCSMPYARQQAHL